MPNWLLPLIVVVAIIIVVVAYLLVARSTLVASGNRARTAWEAVQTALRARADLVPGLLDTLRAHTDGDTSGFAALEVARRECLEAEDPAAASLADSHFQAALSALLASVDGYPKLQGSEEFLTLQSDLAAATDAVQSARRYFNGGVRELNVKLGSVAGKLFGRGLGLTQQDFFELDASTAVAAPPRIQF